MALARLGDFEGAASVLDDAAVAVKNLRQDFILDHGPSLLLYGAISYARGDVEEARGYLERYVQAYPHNASARKMLASVYLRDGDVDQVILMLEPLLRASSDDVQLHALLGEAYMRARRHSEATEMFERAADLAPDRAAIRTRLALSRIATGRSEEAREDLMAALDLDTRATRPGVLLGYLELRRGDHAGALETARELLERDPDNPALHNLEGTAHLAAGDAKAARASFRRAAQLDPSHLAAHLNLGRMDVASGQPELAKKRYREMLRRDSQDTKAMEELASVARRENRLEDAAQWLEKVRAVEPNALRAQLTLVDVYLRMDDPQAAQRVAEQLEVRAPENLSVLEAVARVEVVLGQPGKARVILKRMARFAGYRAQWLHRIAVAQLRLDDAAAAKWSLDKALSADETYLAAHLTMAELQRLEGDIEAALQRADKLRSMFPAEPAGAILKGDLLMRQGRPAEAVEAYEAAHAKGQSGALAIRLYRAQRARGQVAEGVETLERWLASHPADDAVRLVLATAHDGAGRLDAAIETYERLLEGRPDNAVLLNNLAVLYQKVGDARALDYARRAHDLAPENPAIIDTLGWSLALGGEDARALKLLRDAHSRSSREPEIRYHLAVVLSRLGRTAEARRRLEEAFKIEDDFEGATAARALLEKLSGS